MRKHKIAIQGTEASFHHLAAQRLFGEEILLEHCNSFEQVCKKVSSNEVDYAVMAIENLLTGCILANYHLIERYDLNIIGETSLPVELHLIGLWSASEVNIEQVVSHPVALAQCSQLIAERTWKTVQHNDTASSAAYVSKLKSPGVAAISNRETAALYGLSILRENVQDVDGNKTRFLVLSREQVRNEKANKACISFTLPHETGKLSQVLEIVEQLGINLSKIQSVPLVSTHEKYAFILELEYEHNDQFQQLIIHIEPHILKLKVLGMYIKQERIS